MCVHPCLCVFLSVFMCVCLYMCVCVCVCEEGKEKWKMIKGISFHQMASDDLRLVSK